MARRGSSSRPGIARGCGRRCAGSARTPRPASGWGRRRGRGRAFSAPRRWSHSSNLHTSLPFRHASRQGVGVADNTGRMPEQLTAPAPTTSTPEPDAPPPQTVRLQPTKGFGRVLAPRELWRYRDLAFQLAARDVTIRYRQTFFGAAWAILQPLALMVVFAIIGAAAGISSDGLPRGLFGLAALVPWTFL